MNFDKNDPFGFDFGFTIHDESEYVNSEEVEDCQAKINELTERLEMLYESVVPLLNHLRSNPERAMIHWPNRVEKINEFQEKLRTIRDGN
jgi:hypothetical protein